MAVHLSKMAATMIGTNEFVMNFRTSRSEVTVNASVKGTSLSLGLSFKGSVLKHATMTTRERIHEN